MRALLKAPKSGDVNHPWDYLTLSYCRYLVVGMRKYPRCIRKVSRRNRREVRSKEDGVCPANETVHKKEEIQCSLVLSNTNPLDQSIGISTSELWVSHLSMLYNCYTIPLIRSMLNSSPGSIISGLPCHTSCQLLHGTSMVFIFCMEVVPIH